MLATKITSELKMSHCIAIGTLIEPAVACMYDNDFTSYIYTHGCSFFSSRSVRSSQFIGMQILPIFTNVVAQFY